MRKFSSLFCDWQIVILQLTWLADDHRVIPDVRAWNEFVVMSESRGANHSGDIMFEILGSQRVKCTVITCIHVCVSSSLLYQHPRLTRSWNLKLAFQEKSWNFRFCPKLFLSDGWKVTKFGKLCVNDQNIQPVGHFAQCFHQSSHQFCGWTNIFCWMHVLFSIKCVAQNLILRFSLASKVAIFSTRV